MRYENWPDQSHTRGCGCQSCNKGNRLIDRLADRSLSAALRHAQSRAESDFGFEAATPAGSITLPGRFGGWKRAIPLGELFGSTPPEAFVRKGPPPAPGPGLLYRVYEENKQRPLYIGMAFRESIQKRVASHFKPLMANASKLAQTAKASDLAKLWGATPAEKWRSEITKLQALIAATGMNSTIKVQYGEVTPPSGTSIDAKLLHAFESALQVIERPHSYVGSVRTFEVDWF